MPARACFASVAIALALALACVGSVPKEATELRPVPGPDLAQIGARARPAWLREYMTDAAAHPTRIAGRYAPGGRREVIEEFVHFLAARGGPLVAERGSAGIGEVEVGRQLYHGIGCVACHDPLERAEDLELPLWAFEAGLEGEAAELPRSASSLAHLPAKTAPGALAELLRAPHTVYPDGGMPSLGLDAAEAASLAAYLCAGAVHGGRLDLEVAAGLEYEYCEIDGAIDESRAQFANREPTRTGVAATLDGLPEHREEQFALRFTGFVDVPTAGEWTFAVTSDDGSRLWIDGEELVDNSGDHAMVERSGTLALAAGPHALELTFYERSGGEGLLVTWSGPNVEPQSIPAAALSHRAVPLAPGEAFELDAELAERGATRYAEMACAKCHTPPDASSASYIDMLPMLARAAPAEAPGLLWDELERLGCLACHERDGAGGPDAALRPYFRAAGDVDLGDEGRLPPHLDGVGVKLRPEALADVLTGGGRVRPYVRARMPQYPPEDVAHLAEMFRAVDGPTRGWGGAVPLPADLRWDALGAPAFSAESVEHGRVLAGPGKLGCIQCHDLGPYPSLGIRAVDLATVHERIEPAWFRRLMLDPREVGMNSRMPIFWRDGVSPAADVLGGDPGRQTDAVWSWLSLGASMPLPDGLAIPDDEYELTPRERPLQIGVFMRGVGPRTVAVGFPARLHYAFDVGASRLAKVWRGRFFDARGTWHARAGELERPPSDDVLELPPGPTFAVLAGPDERWPSSGACRAVGRRLDADGVPTFRYALGDAVIEERPLPVIAEGGARLVRGFTVRDAPAGLCLRVATAPEITPIPGERGAWTAWTAGGARYALRLGDGAVARVRRSGAHAELLIELGAGPAHDLEVEIAW